MSKGHGIDVEMTTEACALRKSRKVELVYTCRHRLMLQRTEPRMPQFASYRIAARLNHLRHGGSNIRCINFSIGTNEIHHTIINLAGRDHGRRCTGSIHFGTHRQRR